MRRMDKVFKKLGITYEADEWDLMKGPEYDWCRKVVDITGDFIIAVMYSAVLDPELYIYDRRSFQLIAKQDMFPDYTFASPESGRTSRTWGSCCLFE